MVAEVAGVIAMTDTSTVWETLQSINCNDHTEKKGNMTYLSWAWAWGIVKENFPNASFEKHWFTLGEHNNQVPYAMDKQGFAYVKVTVKVGDQTVTETYPITDYKNNAVKTPDSFAVNTALQRCLVKALAYCGLGHYIYAGEDLPMTANDESPSDDDLSLDDEPQNDDPYDPESMKELYAMHFSNIGAASQDVVNDMGIDDAKAAKKDLIKFWNDNKEGREALKKRGDKAYQDALAWIEDNTKSTQTWLNDRIKTLKEDV